MSSRWILWSLVCLTILFGRRAVTAQQRGYQMELSDGTSGRVILVNNTQKTIEAYHFLGSCGPGGQESSYDALDGPSNPRTMTIGPGLNGGSIAQRRVVEPGEHMITFNMLLPQPTACQWKADIDAVIYADGSYEGADESARGMQAKRDGIASGTRYWAQESADGASVETMQADADRLKDEDRKRTMYPGCRKSPIACEYWRGRSQVDGGIALFSRDRKGDPEERRRRLVSYIAEWAKNVDENVALKNLEAVFPLPRDLAEQK